MIDPQLQGIRWIKEKWGESLKIIQLSKPKYINDVEECIKTGTPLIIENLPDDIDAVLDPVVARQTSTKPNGSVVITLGGNELDYDPDFRLYLQTKLSNPHYKPEIAAQTTLVNFCVTEKGLEDQLLALVVEKERFDLQQESNLRVSSASTPCRSPSSKTTSRSASPTPRATSSRTSSSSRTSRRPNAPRRRLLRR